MGGGAVTTLDLEREVRRLRNMIENRGYATVYERTAWHHDLGQHDGSANVYAFCPRCEMEHPQGAYSRLLDAAARMAELLEDGAPGSRHGDRLVDAGEAAHAVRTFNETVARGPHDPHGEDS